jgi:NAD(P)-dependent dehydrogenase (short-subunit alcohol dehydrogenase family)
MKAAIEAAVSGARIATFAGSAMVDAEMEQAVAAAATHGGGLDIIVATVGGGGTFGSVLETDADTFMGTVAANLRPSFLAVRYGVPAMTKGGSIVFISSSAAAVAVTHVAGYATGKAGLDHFVRSVALELAHLKVRLNAVRPGLVRSNQTVPIFSDPKTVQAFVKQTPLARLAEGADVAEAVRFLAGPESSLVTGQSFAVDGGAELKGSSSDGIEMELGDVTVT